MLLGDGRLAGRDHRTPLVAFLTDLQEVPTLFPIPVYSSGKILCCSRTQAESRISESIMVRFGRLVMRKSRSPSEARCRNSASIRRRPPVIVCERRAECRRLRQLTVEPALKHPLHALVGAGTDGQGSPCSRFYTLSRMALAQAQNPWTRPVAHLGVWFALQNGGQRLRRRRSHRQRLAPPLPSPHVGHAAVVARELYMILGGDACRRLLMRLTMFLW